MPATDERQPLLTDSSLECAEVHGSKPIVTPIPWGPISILLLLNTLGPLAYELILPFISERQTELGTIMERNQTIPLSPIFRPDACRTKNRR